MGQKCATYYAKAYNLCIRADAGTNNMSVYLVTEHTGDNCGTCVHFVSVLSMSFRVVAEDNIIITVIGSLGTFCI